MLILRLLVMFLYPVIAAIFTVMWWIVAAITVAMFWLVGAIVMLIFKRVMAVPSVARLGGALGRRWQERTPATQNAMEWAIAVVVVVVIIALGAWGNSR